VLLLSPGACKRGKRRWFHNCIVSPITEAWRADPVLGLECELFSTSRAAAVELSTPPLIATAIVVMLGKWKLETRNWKLETRNSNVETGNWKNRKS
jgi:hypothetical protein